ncbi:MAG: hypothetical protein ACJ8DC_07910 [Gemmatimonadales bacterium]
MTKILLPRSAALLATALFFTGTAMHGQSPPVTSVDVAGWQPADRATPAIRVATQRDAASGMWTYTYTVTNGHSAAQRLGSLLLRTDAPIADVRAPAGWIAVLAGTPSARPAVIVQAELAPPGTRSNALAPGGRLSFTLTSPAAPGTIVYAARGEVPAVSREDLPLSAQKRIPGPESDALRGSTMGPVP